MRLKLLILFLVLLLAVPILAQSTPPLGEGVDTSGVSDDEVNAIANQLYCPVCENIPLDTCGTAACSDWREEIRIMIASGMSPEAIIANFIERFGERVVGTPQDPLLRGLSLITPYAVAGLALLVALWTLIQWQRRSVTAKAKVSPSGLADDSHYRDMLEKDLRG